MTKKIQPHIAESVPLYQDNETQVTLDVHENGTTALVARTKRSTGTNWKYYKHHITDPFDQDKQQADLQAFLKDIV